MPGSGARAGPDGVHPELCGEVTGNRQVDSGERLGLVLMSGLSSAGCQETGTWGKLS